MGTEEFQQSITLLLKNTIGSFFQSPFVGAKFDIHSDEDILKEGIIQTLKELTGVEVLSVELNNENAYVSLKYFDEITKFQFTIKDEN